jgi:hypothetical protein
LGNSNKLFLFDASKIKIKWILNFFKNIYFFNQIVIKIISAYFWRSFCILDIPCWIRQSCIVVLRWWGRSVASKPKPSK